MWQPKEFIPEGLKNYVRLVRAKLRRPESFIGSHLVADGAALGRNCSVSAGAQLADGVEVGDYSYVNCGAIIASGVFGRFCSIGPYALIGMPEHPMDFLSTSPLLYGRRNIFGEPSEWNDFPDPPKVGSDVWIGAFSFVRQGVQIGHGAIIGAGAVVTHDVPPYGIAVGVPARVRRFRFDQRTVADLLESCWWERGTEELAADPACFRRPWATAPVVEPTL